MIEGRNTEAAAVAARRGRDGALDAALERLDGGRASLRDRGLHDGGQVSSQGREACPGSPFERQDTPDLHVTAVRRLPAVAAQYAPFPAALDERLQRALESRGIARLYTHQAESIEHALAGRNVVVITPTASGKTLCYNAPVLHSILRDPSSRALYLFPTKALAQDQLAELQAMCETLAGSCGDQIGAFTYDGDTPQDARRTIRGRAHLVLSNPDMVHSGILPHHPRWTKLFENLRYVIIDELHAYRGVFGSHLGNVLRRLRRVCRHYGSNPVFLCSSATIANPRELAERLTEQPFELVNKSGAPRGEKFFVFVNPPVVNHQLGIRRSYLSETRRIAAEFLKRNLQLIAFAQSRLSTEILTTYLKDDFEDVPGGPERIRGYRGGYLPNRRREIEKGLREGAVRAVVSTNALELGIDIGALDVCVMAGYPGTIASTWQRAGRAGRRAGRSAAVMVASSAPIDQFVVRNPSYFFGASPERALVDPDNLHILVDHIKCAAFELPFRATEAFGKHDVQEILSLLAEQGLVCRQPFPEAESLRSRPRESEDLPAHGGGAPCEIEKAESLRSRPRESEDLPAHDSLEPLRGADAASNRDGGGVPGALEEGGAADEHPSRERESLGSSARTSEAVPARDSLEPLRGADAASNGGGGGVPAALEEGGAADEHPSPERESLGSSARTSEAEPARDSLEPLRGADAASNSAGGGVSGALEEGGAPREVEQWTWTSESYPADAVSLRSVSSDNFVVVDTTRETRVIGETDFTSGPATLHPKAIYLVEGQLYQVERLDFEGRKAFVRDIDCDYYTDAITYTRVTILDTFETGEAESLRSRPSDSEVLAASGGGAPRELENVAPLASHGEVQVVSRVVGFKKIKFYTNENIGSGELDLPEQQMHTTSYWLTIPAPIMASLPYALDDRRDGVVGLAFAIRQVAQLLLMCDRHDIGISIDTGERAEPTLRRASKRPELAGDTSPRLFIYDNYPGGVGFSEPLFCMHRELLSGTRHLIAQCECESGCPGCVGPVGDTGPLAKAAALRILDLLLDEA